MPAQAPAAAPSTPPGPARAYWPSVSPPATNTASDMALKIRIRLGLGQRISFLVCVGWVAAPLEGVTRSSRRYCSAGATLGRGGAQAHQSQGRGLNNLLKLL